MQLNAHLMIDIDMQEVLGRLPYLVALAAEQRAVAGGSLSMNPSCSAGGAGPAALPGRAGCGAARGGAGGTPKPNPNPERAPSMLLQEALGRLPYLVALDAEQRAVVLAVRGTSSLSDALTDAIAQPCDLLAGWLGRAAQAR